MATAKIAKLERESARTFFDYTAGIDSGDQKIYTVSGKTIFSDKSGYELNVRPDGVVTGRNLLTPGTAADTVNLAGFTAYLVGILKTVSAEAALAMESGAVRPATDVAKISSVQLAADGTTVEVIPGTDASGVIFSETRGGEGGPPFVVVGSIEVGQIRLTTSASAIITSAEIFQTDGTHVERFDMPAWKLPVSNLGDGNKADAVAQKNAYVELDTAQSVGVHTGDAFKPVYVSGYTPTFTEIGNSVDFKPAQNSHSTSSKQVYNNTLGSVSSSLGQASFTADGLNDGITDALIADEDEILVFRFYPNRNKTPYSLTQGTLGMVTTYPVAEDISVASTISAPKKTVLFSS